MNPNPSSNTPAIAAPPPGDIKHDPKKPFSPSRSRRDRNNLLWGMAFLSPNILGFLAFTLVPLVMSLGLAFSNWDLRLHNMFTDERVKFIGVDHFINLFNDRNFYQYLGNTLFFLLSLPIGIALALLGAVLLSQDLTGGGRRGRGLTTASLLGISVVMVTSVVLLTLTGMFTTALMIVLAGLFGVILVGGSIGGQTVYRTLFYIPNFVSGVATILLWKKLYNPIDGPINSGLEAPLAAVGRTALAMPPWLFPVLSIALFSAALFLLARGVYRLRSQHVDGDIGFAGFILGSILLALPLLLAFLFWAPASWMGSVSIGLLGLLIGFWIFQTASRPVQFKSKTSEGIGGAIMLGILTLAGASILIGLASVARNLPIIAGDTEGLTPPLWLQTPFWAKPAIMLMGLWGAIGSQTMLLYLAALTNVPGELYEAADIDGAKRSQKFWNVTWPQLAPTTFFVFVMGIIGGLQAGFEVARIMTQGGPAGSTTTLAYFIYAEGFETGRLGFSSAVSWTMFILVLSVTLFNWKFGNKYVND